MATSVYNITFDRNSGSYASLIRYKAYGDTDWTIPNSPPNPTTNLVYPLTLTQGVCYYIAVSDVSSTCNYPNSKIISKCIPVTSTTTTTTTSHTTTTSSSTTTTTTTGVPVVVTTITGLGSPLEVYYNPADSLMYYTDFDTIGNLSITDGGIGYFNPTTATSIADITYPLSARGFMLEHGKYDPVNNKIFVQGRKSGGLKIFDCVTKTVTSTVTYGTSSASYQGRQIVYIFNNTVFAGFADISGFVTVDPASGTRGTDFIPANTGSFPSFRLQQVGSELWVFETNSNSTHTRLITYNISDLSTVTSTTNDLNTATDYNSRYTISDIYYDQPNNKIWYVGFGDLKIYWIDTITKTIGSTNIPPEGKSYSFVTPIFNTQSNTLYFSGGLINNGSDPGLSRTYQVDRSTGAILATFNSSYANFVYSPPVNHTYAASPGLLSYSSPNTGYDTDGSLIIYN